MASQKQSSPGVAVVFQDLDIRMYAFTPEKLLRLGGQDFCLAII